MSKLPAKISFPWSADDSEHIVGIHDTNEGCIRDAMNSEEISTLEEKANELTPRLSQFGGSTEIRKGLCGGQLLILKFPQSMDTKTVRGFDAVA